MLRASPPEAPITHCSAPHRATGVKYLSSALIEFYQDKREAGIDPYSERCLRRIWRAERFSWWFTGLMHRFPENGEIRPVFCGKL